MQDISVFGSIATITASLTAPNGFVLDSFSDDTDAISADSTQIMDTAMTVGGEAIGWKKANLIPKIISVIADSEEDNNLKRIVAANRAIRGKKTITDIITMTITKPDGNQEVYSRGYITEGMIGTGLGSDGRKRTKTYTFAFEQYTMA